MVGASPGTISKGVVAFFWTALCIVFGVTVVFLKLNLSNWVAIWLVVNNTFPAVPFVPDPPYVPDQFWISKVLLTKELSEFANCKEWTPEPKVRVDPLLVTYKLPTRSGKPAVLKSPPSK